jgi:hypothetical protein
VLATAGQLLHGRQLSLSTPVQRGVNLSRSILLL